MNFKKLFLYVVFIQLFIISTVYSNDIQIPNNCNDNITLPQDWNKIFINSTEQLLNITSNLTPKSILILEEGIYDISHIKIDTPNIVIMGNKKNKDNTILTTNYKKGHNIISVKAENVTIAHLTLKKAYYHPIHVSGNGNYVQIHDINIYDGREQFIKINPDSNNNMNDYGSITCSYLELTNSGRSYIHKNPTPGFKCYTGGIDAHKAEGWIVKYNTIKGIYCTNGGLAEHAIHFWSTSRDTIVENNIIINSARGIGFGMGVNGGGSRTYDDFSYDGYLGHIGGIIRNNLIYISHNSILPYFDTGIALEQAYNTKVYHNTLVSKPTWASIDYRFENTNASIINNLVYNIKQRNGGNAFLSNNLENPPTSYFIDITNGNYNLSESAFDAIDNGLILDESGIDLNGNNHTINDFPDIGSYEYIFSINVSKNNNEDNITNDNNNSQNSSKETNNSIEDNTEEENDNTQITEDEKEATTTLNQTETEETEEVEEKNQTKKETNDLIKTNDSDSKTKNITSNNKQNTTFKNITKITINNSNTTIVSKNNPEENSSLNSTKNSSTSQNNISNNDININNIIFYTVLFLILLTVFVLFFYKSKNTKKILKPFKNIKLKEKKEKHDPFDNLEKYNEEFFKEGGKIEENNERY